MTAIALAANGLELYQGGLDNNIKVWDLRAKGVINSLTGHTDSITSLRTSPDSEYLLSHSFDSTVWMWDIKPYAPLNRHVRTFDGATSGMEKNLHKASWDRTGKRIAAGGGDHTVTIWETETGKLISKLPGHRGAVNDVSFSPSDDDLSKCTTFSSCSWTPANRGIQSQVALLIRLSFWVRSERERQMLQSKRRSKSCPGPCSAQAGPAGHAGDCSVRECWTPATITDMDGTSDCVEAAPSARTASHRSTCKNIKGSGRVYGANVSSQM